ncbi:ABC transporter substrate-binding protein [Cohnella abietis]|uniref:Glutathione ABC transporter substrate-binding protein n=1 Tax=Cohnella abietis TaxID=2507935 RepID=A0A3T1DCB2_9BACL|nr:ABC transporter substrate-binding protein [Cohnella abietis]BBI35575.1 glutathione ABC transporter substrate-binding protein [Cohnella abietis]
MARLTQRVGIIIVLVLTLVLSACSSTEKPSGTADVTPSPTNQGSAASEQGGKFRVGLSNDARLLDPAHTYDSATIVVEVNIVESLFHFDDNLSLQPVLVESFEQPEPTVYEYKLRKGVTFHDGTELKATDVVASLNRIKNPKTASEFNYMFKNFKSAEALDDYTVKVVLSTPDTLWNTYLATPAGGVLPEAFINKYGNDIGKPDVGVIGTGPYKFESWKTGSQITLAKNAQYWDAENPPHMDQVVFRVIPDDNTRVSAMQSGELDALHNPGGNSIGLSTELVGKVKQFKNVTVQQAETFNYDWVAINVSRKPLDDRNVRVAINQAFPQKQAVEKLLGEAGTPAKDFISPTLWTFEKDVFQQSFDKLPSYEYNLEEAKKTLASSSSPDGFTATLITDNRPSRLNLAEAFSSSLREIGIKVEIKQVSIDEYYTYLFGQNRDYDFIVGGWAPDFPDPAGNLEPLFWSGNITNGGSNRSSYSNPEFDKLLEQSNQEQDLKKRAELLASANEILVNDAPYVLLGRRVAYFAIRDEFAGYKLTPDLYDPIAARIYRVSK